MTRRYMRWTEGEDELIRSYFPTNGATWGGWRRLMPERNPSPGDVRQRARRIGVSYDGDPSPGRTEREALDEATLDATRAVAALDDISRLMLQLQFLKEEVRSIRES